MGIVASKNGSYSYKEGEHVFLQGKDVNSISILAKGKVDVYIATVDQTQRTDDSGAFDSSYKLFSIDQNIFVGANDLFLSGKHSFSYRASEDSVIFSYFADSINDIEELFRQKNDYPTYVLNSVSSIVDYSYNSLKKLEEFVVSLKTTADNLCLFFWILKEKHGFSYEPVHPAFGSFISGLQEMKEKGIFIPYSYDEEFLERSHFEYDYSPTEDIDTLKLDYYRHLSSLESDIKKQFLSESFIIAQYSCTDCALLLESIIVRIKEALLTAEEYMELLYSKDKDCVFSEYINAASQLKDSKYDSMDMVEVLQYISGIIKNSANVITHDYRHSPSINLDSIEEKIQKLVSSLKIEASEESAVSISFASREGIPEELKDSAEKILEYSELPKERCDFFMNSLKAFRGLKDKLSDDLQIRKLRRDITTVFFELYEAVLKRVTAEDNHNKLLHMFLTYAYVDEKLLSPENLWTLYEISDKASSSDELSVFTMKNWLQLIYKKKKDPSVNEFSMDYFDVFREMRKHGEISDKDKAKYDNNIDGRLSFEINNMFKPNHRLCSPYLGTYFPILYDDVVIKNLDKALVTPEKIDKAIQKILKVDFTAFHREISYFNMKKGIEKECIMQSVKPDIILMPIYGATAIMWQEISGRVRNTPGRFIIPIFTNGNLDDMVVKLIGEFRWELCKTMMGLAWNDITIKSLTSEYMDYLQFFKKNRDISEEVKEKIKHQIKKYRNISRDIFASDYSVWVNYESHGTIRLNKLTRDILYKHCPFSKEIREKLKNHPSFSSAANLFENRRTKQARDLENRYSKYTREGIALDKEMIDTLDFYKNL